MNKQNIALLRILSFRCFMLQKIRKKIIMKQEKEYSTDLALLHKLCSQLLLNTPSSKFSKKVEKESLTLLLQELL